MENFGNCLWKGPGTSQWVTCQWNYSPQIKSWPGQLPPSATPERSSGWMSGWRYSVIWNFDRAGQDRQFLEKSLWALILPSSHSWRNTTNVFIDSNTFFGNEWKIHIKSQNMPSLVAQYLNFLSANPRDTSSMPGQEWSHVPWSKLSVFTTTVEPII